MGERLTSRISSERSIRRGCVKMKTPGEVRAMLELHEQGYSSRAVAQMLGCDHKTVLRYVRQGEWRPMRREPGRLDGLEGWLEERMAQHRGNADVIRQELLREHGTEVSLRTVERAVQPLRQRLRTTRLACVRFESPPGDQLQIDFGSKRVEIAGRSCKVHVFVATLGYSRRQFAAAGVSGIPCIGPFPVLPRGGENFSIFRLYHVTSLSTPTRSRG